MSHDSLTITALKNSVFTVIDSVFTVTLLVDAYFQQNCFNDLAYSFTLTCGVFVAGRAVLAAQGLNPEAAEVPTEDNPEAAEVSTQGTQSEDETAEPDVPRESSSSSAWSHADTLLLIDTYRKYRGMMRDPTKKKKEVWKVIADKMNEVQKSNKFSAFKCSKKWNNLEIRYKGKRDKPKKTGRGGGKEWIYYQRMDSIIGNTASAASVSASCQAASETTKSDKPLLAPDSDTSAEEEQERAAATSVKSRDPQPATSRKRSRDQPPEWVKVMLENMEKNQRERHEELTEMLKRQEEAMKERTQVMKEVKDIFKAWVDKQ